VIRYALDPFPAQDEIDGLWRDAWNGAAAAGLIRLR